MKKQMKNMPAAQEDAEEEQIVPDALRTPEARAARRPRHSTNRKRSTSKSG